MTIISKALVKQAADTASLQEGASIAENDIAHRMRAAAGAHATRKSSRKRNSERGKKSRSDGEAGKTSSLKLLGRAAGAITLGVAMSLGLILLPRPDAEDSTVVINAAPNANADAALVLPANDSPAEPRPVIAPVPTPIVVRVEIATPAPPRLTYSPRSPDAAIETAALTPIIASENTGPASDRFDSIARGGEMSAREVRALYNLNAVFWHPDKPGSVIINNRIVHEGGRIGDLVIKKIEKTRVIAELDGIEYKLGQ